jgi:hypothetical protein
MSNERSQLIGNPLGSAGDAAPLLLDASAAARLALV